jgi:hypothetical protein
MPKNTANCRQVLTVESVTLSNDCHARRDMVVMGNLWPRLLTMSIMPC